MLDALAQRYHILPSQAWQQADALDYVVMTTSQAWMQQQQLRQDRGAGMPVTTHRHTTQDLQAMLNKVRSQ